jgi:SLT domain-containing protein
VGRTCAAYLLQNHLYTDIPTKFHETANCSTAISGEAAGTQIHRHCPYKIQSTGHKELIIMMKREKWTINKFLLCKANMIQQGVTVASDCILKKF